MSGNIPTFADYMSGNVTISAPNKILITNADLSDKYTSIEKLTKLTESIATKIADLQILCNPQNTTIPSEQKKNCSNNLSAHMTNNLAFNTLLRTLLQQTPKKSGGKRQTRRHSKHNKNRKQNLKSRRRRNEQKLKSRRYRSKR